jgi:hypothetical protein
MAPRLAAHHDAIQLNPALWARIDQQVSSLILSPRSCCCATTRSSCAPGHNCSPRSRLACANSTSRSHR